MAPREPHTEEECLVFKMEHEDGKIVGGCVVDIHPPKGHTAYELEKRI